MNIAVAFDGGGLARLGLEQAGHVCTGFEIDPIKHYLSQMVGSGNCILADVRDIDFSGFDAIWLSPPCQEHSDQNHGTAERSGYLLDWSLELLSIYPEKTIWIENVVSRVRSNAWGTFYNAAQFLETPIQNRYRVVGGRFPAPRVYRPCQAQYRGLNICPSVMAAERNGAGISLNPKTERRKASLWYGRLPSIAEMAYHQGFIVPDDLIRSWYHIGPFLRETPTGKLKPYTRPMWTAVLSEAVGNGVPVYMARAFGEALFRTDQSDFAGLPLFYGDTS